MAGTDQPVLNPVVRWHHSSRDEWNALDARTQATAKVAALVACTVVAYHYSLVSLLQTLGLDTPLAYLGLVPLIAGGLAWINRAPRVTEPPIHDRQLDYIIGLPLVLISVLGEAVVPGHLGAMFWVDRVDLLTLPFFVAGATVLLFGVRVAWRQKVALAYLFLGWPWLYTSVLLGTLGGFTSLTVRGLCAALDVFHVASPVSGGTGLFDVVHDGHTILISVVTACSGVDGMVGFLLIGAALTAVVSGSLTRKALWLGVGLALLWCLNLARLLLICWVARVAGPRLALGALHPAAGLVMFCLGVGLMSVLLRPFGLRRRATVAPASSPAGTSASSPVFSTVVILLLATVVLSVSDSGLRVFDPVAGATGEPKLGSFLADPATPAGWTASFVTEYDMNKPLFGEDSRWFRYTLSDTAPQSSSLHSRLPVTADVIDAGGLSGFEAYGVTACYSFHGYVLRDVATVDLGDGIKGQALSYSGGAALSHQDWSIVYWILPVETGAGTRYERVILYVQNTAAASVSLAPGVPGAAQLTATRKAADPEQRLLLTDQTFLVAFARQVIAGQVHQRDTGVLVDAITTPNSTASVWAASRAQDQAGQAPSGGSTASAAGSSSPAAGPDAGFWLAYGQHHVTPAATSGGR